VGQPLIGKGLVKYLDIKNTYFYKLIFRDLSMPLGITTQPGQLVALIRRSQSTPRKRAFEILRSGTAPRFVPAIMLNVLQPGTYPQPHKHTRKGKGHELITLLQGAAYVPSFDDDGKIDQVHMLSGDSPFVEVPGGTYHTVLPIQPNTAIVELYTTVYNAENYKQFAPWAPEENIKQPREHRRYLTDITSQCEILIGASAQM